MSIVGIDIGGTRIRLVLADATGRVRARSGLATEPEAGPGRAVGRMVQGVRELAAKAGDRIEAVGIGVTGPVDPLTGIVDNPHTLGGWPPTDLRSPVEDAFGVPVAVDNDANVAAVGEGWIGAGRGARRLAMVTIGTGIGVAVVIDGAVQRATDGRHGEAGHMVLDPSGPECYCGARGCWESLASGTALGRAARERAWSDDGLLRRLSDGDPDKIDARLLFQAAAAGDRAAAEVVDAAARHIGLGLVNLASTVMPDVFVLAGGVAAHLPVLSPVITDVLRRHAVMIPTEVPVVPAELGDDAGPIGAARLALELLNRAG
jgi:glucokinase